MIDFAMITHSGHANIAAVMHHQPLNALHAYFDKSIFHSSHKEAAFWQDVQRHQQPRFLRTLRSLQPDWFYSLAVGCLFNTEQRPISQNGQAHHSTAMRRQYEG